jgi:hypothetical protein
MLLDRIGATMKPFEQQLFDRTEKQLRTSLGEAGLADAIAAGERDAVDGILALSRTVTGAA